jgi:cytosine/uracil/thiamine/allantoin permease
MAKPVKVLRMWDVLVPLSSRGVATFLEMWRLRCVVILHAMKSIRKLKVSARTKMDILRLVVSLGMLGAETLDVHGSTD